MYESNKKALAYFPETETWHALILIKIPMVDPQNELTAGRAPTALDDSRVKMPVKHELSEKFEREKFDGEIFGKGEPNNLVTR